MCEGVVCAGIVCEVCVCAGVCVQVHVVCLHYNSPELQHSYVLVSRRSTVCVCFVRVCVLCVCVLHITEEEEEGGCARWGAWFT